MIKKNGKMAKTPTPFRPALGDEVEGMLEDFCEAHHLANATEVVRRAVRRFIENDLARNEGARDAYDALRRTRRKG